MCILTSVSSSLRAVDQCLGSPEPCDPLRAVVESSSVESPYHAQLSQALSNLPSIQSTYLDQFSAVLTEKAVMKSRWAWSVPCGGCGHCHGSGYFKHFLFVRAGNFSPVRLGIQSVFSFPHLLVPCCPEIGYFSPSSANIPRHCKGLATSEKVLKMLFPSSIHSVSCCYWSRQTHHFLPGSPTPRDWHASCVCFWQASCL